MAPLACAWRSLADETASLRAGAWPPRAGSGSTLLPRAGASRPREGDISKQDVYINLDELPVTSQTLSMHDGGTGPVVTNVFAFTLNSEMFSDKLDSREVDYIVSRLSLEFNPVCMTNLPSGDDDMSTVPDRHLLMAKVLPSSNSSQDDGLVEHGSDIHMGRDETIDLLHGHRRAKSVDTNPVVDVTE